MAENCTFMDLPPGALLHRLILTDDPLNPIAVLMKMQGGLSTTALLQTHSPS